MAGVLFGKAVLSVAMHPRVAAAAARSPLTRDLVRRYVAGETLDEAIAAVRTLNAQGMRITLDHLGENVSTTAAAVAATDEALRAVERIHDAGVDSNVSVKLTQLGLDQGEHVVVANATRLLEGARARGNFVRIDMEGSAYTARTIEIFTDLRRRFENVGIVLQAYLYRSMADARELTALGARIRLCKGAYREAPHISYRRKRDTDRNYARIMGYLLREGNYPALATHDARIIEQAIADTRAWGIGPDRFEFQMLYGVRRDLQESLVARGFGVRIYVPYGSQWYPYLTRRLAERPANLVFVVGNMLRERQAGRVHEEVRSPQ